jgi:hypothetical protein
MNRLLFDFITDDNRGMKDVVVTLDHVPPAGWNVLCR